jgi:hypothetical protein
MKTMPNEDQDWLDRQLAANTYIADEGFTAQVVKTLPKERPRGLTARQKILFSVSLVSACLAVALVATALTALNQGSVGAVNPEKIERGFQLLKEPTVIYGGAGLLFLATIAAIPLIRRWV